MLRRPLFTKNTEDTQGDGNNGDDGDSFGGNADNIPDAHDDRRERESGRESIGTRYVQFDSMF